MDDPYKIAEMLASMQKPPMPMRERVAQALFSNNTGNEFVPNYVRPETIGGFGTPAVAAFLQMIDPKGLTPDQLDRQPELQRQLLKKAWQEHPELLGQSQPYNFSENAERRWTGEDVNSVMIKFNNWRRRNTGQELTPQERITEGFIDTRNPNSWF